MINRVKLILILTSLVAIHLISPMVSAVPKIEVSPLDYNFGNVEVETAALMTVTITNTGNSSLAIDEITLDINGDSSFVITAAPFLSAFFGPGGHVDVEITFTPLVSGDQSTVLEIVSNDPDEPLVQINLSGRGGQLTPSEQMNLIFDFIDDSVTAGQLSGDGLGKSAKGRLGALTNMLETAAKLIEKKKFEEALGQLKTAYKRTDGKKRPPDFVSGNAASELAEKIQAVLENIKSG